MWLYAKLAWRNLFRNKRRSIIAGVAIGIGLAALIFVDALLIGMERNMVDSATSSFLGDGQIHREGFRETQEVELTIRNLDQTIASLRQEEIVEAFSPRVMAFSMLTSPADVTSIMLVGVRPATEQYLSQIDDTIVAGEYFAGDNERDIIVGYKLAERLEVEIGDRVVVTVAQAESGDLSQEMFRISGIYRFNTQEMDQGMAFVRLPKAQTMLGLGENVHEIALKLAKQEVGRDQDHQIWKKYSNGGNEAIGWTIILPQLEAAFQLSDFSKYITALILFGVVSLGIVNTLFMSLHERMFEFGVLRAVGTRPFRMALLIILEAAALALLSIALGIILGFVVTYLVRQSGIDYTGIEMVGVTFRELLYPELNGKQFVIYPVWLFVFTLLIAIYPAVYAARLTPAESMRKSM